VHISASCRCGEVRFESKEDPVIQLCCHCTDCRDVLTIESKALDYATIAFFKKSTVQLRGEAGEKVYTAASGNKTVREYCTRCDAVMFDKSEGFPTLVGVFAQHIDPPFQIKPACHVWVKDKLSHVPIPEGVTQHEKGIPQR